ncbi:kinesin-like nuclear fusion protein [Podila humilis]|nr:kinesin-like nuclear fusion protein [Podila humilis]
MSKPSEMKYFDFLTLSEKSGPHLTFGTKMTTTSMDHDIIKDDTASATTTTTAATATTSSTSASTASTMTPSIGDLPPETLKADFSITLQSESTATLNSTFQQLMDTIHSIPGLAIRGPIRLPKKGKIHSRRVDLKVIPEAWLREIAVRSGIMLSEEPGVEQVQINGVIASTTTNIGAPPVQMEQQQEKKPSKDPLNRSISKLKQPTRIKSSASVSSTISTTLAVATAVQGSLNSMTENIRRSCDHSTPQPQALSLKSTSTTPVGGNVLKRKAEQEGINKRQKNETPGRNIASGPKRVVNGVVTPVTTHNTYSGRPSVTTQRPLGTRPSAPAPSRPAQPAVARIPLRKTTVPRLSPSSTASTAPASVPKIDSKPSETIATVGSRRPTIRGHASVQQPRTATATTTTTTAAMRGRTTTASTVLAKKQPAKAPINRTGTRSTLQQPSPAHSILTASQASQSSCSRESTVASAAPVNEPVFLSLANAPESMSRPRGEKRGQREDAEDLCHILSGFEEHLAGLIEAKKNETSSLELMNKAMEDKLQEQENEENACLERIKAMERDIEISVKRNEDELVSLKSRHVQIKEEFKIKEARLKHEIKSMEDSVSRTDKLLGDQLQRSLSLRSTIASQSAKCSELEGDNVALQKKHEEAENTLADRDARIKDLERTIAGLKTSIAQLEEQIRMEETLRRKLHNTIQELKGNIRVFCRVRPVSTNRNATKQETTTASITFPDYPEQGKQIEFAHAKESARGNSIEKSYPFAFDRVFQPTSTQQDVFDEISQLVQSALDGYNVCIFAYGQTGSGKTHTMEGPLNASREEMGMIPRSVLQIYENAKQLESKGWKYTMEGQYVEIYNETINDLLGNYSTSAADQNGKRHEIRHGPDGKTTITDITTVVLTSPERVAALLKKATHNRSVGSTQMNERSSRSHCVFTLRLTGINSVTEETSEGVLNLIDLAGSERLSQSGATGDRLRETQAINKSLSCLGDVIYAIANKDTHVPYRNSKLTYLLQNSLGGNSKTLMFVNISPLLSNVGETLCSLRFATKVNSCKIGTATSKRAVK